MRADRFNPKRNSFYDRKGLVLMFVVIGVTAIVMCALVMHDLRGTSQQAREMQAVSMREIELLSELQYQAEEARRTMLYALTTIDSNLQVEYAEQSRAADARVTLLVQEDRKAGRLPIELEANDRFERDWSDYLKTRDEVLALILEGGKKEAIELDSRDGVKTFNRVRDDLQEMMRLNKEQADWRVAAFGTSSNRSLVKLIITLSLTLLITAFAVRLIQKKMLHTVQQSEMRLRGVIESISEGMCVLGEDWRIELWNDAAVHISNKPQTEVLGRRLLEAFPAIESTSLPPAISEAIASGSKDVVPALKLGEKKNSREYEVRIFPFEGSATIFFNDVSERHRLEHQLRQSQKMEAIGKLAGGVAHDFNNLLTVISGYAQLALRRLHENNDLRSDVFEISKAAERAASLTRQLLAFSRKQVLEPRVLDLNSVVQEMDKMLRRLIGEHIDLLTILDPSLSRVTADPGQIEQVIMNLAVNARDAMPTGGKLMIETANIEFDRESTPENASVPPGSYVMIAISDTGCGMDAETRSRIFEPFFTTKEVGQGTGLGLSTVYGIVNQSGGHIWLYSEPGVGTTFKVCLPRLQNSLEPVESPGIRGEAMPRGQETVLLVEDEASVRKLVCDVLQGSGYTVLEAHNGKEAFRIGAQHTGPIHLMLTDMVMPEVGGCALADQLCPLRPEMRVLFMSGYTEDSIMHHGVLDPGVAFLQKPFAPNAIVGKVREVLDGPRATKN